MIPKTIHYCWFGRTPLPKDAQRCIASWRKYLPDYEIKEWNEDNFDIDICPYVRQAYDQRKYAFASDYARYYVLYHHGGLYFDTDVELIRRPDTLIDEGPFMGIEQSLYTNGQSQEGEIGVNPGLGLAAPAGMDFYREILAYYDTKDFDIAEGTIVYHTTRLLKKYGLKNENVKQHVAGITIYPTDVLCPMDSTTGIVTTTDSTVSIHHYSCSWIDRNTLSFRLHLLKNKLISVFGPKLIMRLASILKRND